MLMTMMIIEVIYINEEFTQNPKEKRKQKRFFFVWLEGNSQIHPRRTFSASRNFLHPKNIIFSKKKYLKIFLLVAHMTISSKHITVYRHNHKIHIIHIQATIHRKMENFQLRRRKKGSHRLVQLTKTRRMESIGRIIWFHTHINGIFFFLFLSHLFLFLHIGKCIFLSLEKHSPASD